MSWELHNADCLGPEGMGRLGDKSVEHVICDPPYEAEAHTLGRRVLGGTRPGHAVETWRDAQGIERYAGLPFEPITDTERAEAARQIARVTRRWALVFCQAEAAHKWDSALIEAGMGRRRWCVWVKPDGQPQLTGDRPGVGYETIIACHTPGRSRWNGGGKLGVFRHVKNVTGSREQNAHPTMKPLALMEALVRDFTDPGDLICDPFAGSGTTGVAAVHLGRRFVGWERDPKYAEIARQRLSSTRQQYNLFEAVGG